jgi:hypothetical protein
MARHRLDSVDDFFVSQLVVDIRSLTNEAGLMIHQESTASLFVVEESSSKTSVFGGVQFLEFHDGLLMLRLWNLEVDSPSTFFAKHGMSPTANAGNVVLPLSMISVTTFRH